jgi:hypothetical protein
LGAAGKNAARLAFALDPDRVVGHRIDVLDGVASLRLHPFTL